MPRVSAEADSVSAMRITRKAIARSVFDIGCSARNFCHGVTNAPRCDGLPQQLHVSRQNGKKRKITATIMISRSVAQIAQRCQGTAGFIPPNQRPHGNANGNDPRNSTSIKENTVPGSRAFAAHSSPKLIPLPAPFRASRPLRSAGSVPYIRHKLSVVDVEITTSRPASKAASLPVESFFMLFFRRSIGKMEALHILPYRLQISFRMNEILFLHAHPTAQCSVTRTCN